MKTATKKGAKQVVLTSGDVRRMIEEEAKKGENRLELRGCIVESVCLDGIDVPMALGFKGATILGDFCVVRSKFTGNIIDLDGATVNGRVKLIDLGSQSFSLYLRNARVGENVSLCAVSIDWLCIGGLRVKQGWVHTQEAVTFNIGISLDPCY